MKQQSFQSLVDTFGTPTRVGGKFFWDTSKGRIVFCAGCGFIKFGNVRISFGGVNFQNNFDSLLKEFSVETTQQIEK